MSGSITKRIVDDGPPERGGVSFFCPGCKGRHVVWTSGGEAWTWNGSYERPTFTPSVLIRSGHYGPGGSDHCWCTYNAERKAEGKKPVPFECGVCHSFVTDGRIQYLDDCTHALVGQTVELPPIVSSER